MDIASVEFATSLLTLLAGGWLKFSVIFLLGNMNCINGVCVGQPCNQSSDCPRKEKCYDGKCLRIKSKNSTNCASHDICTAKNETQICAKRK